MQVQASSILAHRTAGHDGLVALGTLIRSPRCVRFADDPPRCPRAAGGINVDVAQPWQRQRAQNAPSESSNLSVGTNVQNAIVVEQAYTAA